MSRQSGSQNAESNHRYNDDLLLFKRSREFAKLEFPEVYHVLDNPELRAAFEPIDRAAKRAKQRSQQAGFWAVVLAVLALIGASAELLWRDLPSPWPMLFTLASARDAFDRSHYSAGRQKDCGWKSERGDSFNSKPLSGPAQHSSSLSKNAKFTNISLPLWKHSPNRGHSDDDSMPVA
jgi:hypothetical protein